MNIDVIIPCYNEENTIEKIILESIKHLSSKDNLIIVDDGSTDKSNFIIRKLENKFSNINLVKHEKNLGKGAAIQTALKRVQNEIVIIQDSDLEYNPSEYKKLINPLLKLKADVVYGSRFVSSDEHRVLYYWHKIGNNIITFLSNIFTNLNLTDIEVGYKAFKSEKILKLNLKEKRFGFEPEVTIKLAREKCIFYEVGISYRGRTYKEGKKIGLLDAFVAIYCIIRYSIFD
jgi:glycosyltransferase involved in cell wall biosynthesis|tara:strand:+ start:1772 stop:2464 length:693 start_codon:yes stop_codon:yes gene_type:complete